MEVVTSHLIFGMKKLFVLALKIATYLCCLSLGVVLAYNLKFGFQVPIAEQKSMWLYTAWSVPFRILFLIFLGEFKGIFTYFRMSDFVKITMCLSSFSFVLLLSRVFVNDLAWIPSREIILSDLLFSLLFILFFRASLRIINGHWGSLPFTNPQNDVLRVAVIGTNDFASQVISEIKTRKHYKMVPVAVLDDNTKYFGRTLHDVPVLGVPDLIQDLAQNNKIDGVLFVGGVLPKKRLAMLSEMARQLHIKTLTIPSIGDFLTGRAFASTLRPLEVEDFLKRDVIHLNLDNCRKELMGKVVLITGGGGSIGSELAIQVAKNCPEKLILVDHSEYNLFKIDQTLKREGYDCIPILLNVTHKEALRGYMAKYRPNIIFHAAAYKHVHLLEYQPLVALENNVLSTGYLAQYACEFGADKFVFVSTDKAIQPISNLGATKRIGEMICMALSQQSNCKTQFMAVRFGNVLGSAGSVLPTFREQIMHGGPVTVTHPEMTRFFMTIPEAVSLILEAASFESVGGKIFVLDMGNPVKILDVAKQMIELNGLKVGTDIEIVFTGIRPGEKLHEDLVFDPAKISPTDNKLIGTFKEDNSYLAHMESIPEILEAIEHLASDEACISFIRKLIPEFKA